MRLSIRPEAPADAGAIHALNVAAFGGDVEAALVDTLRDADGLTLSLVGRVAPAQRSAVAIEAGTLVGHIAFSPVTVKREDGARFEGIGLAPMAVAPSAQRSGVGSQLVRAGLERLARGGHRFCVVLGHPEYYPRFGFVRASTFGLSWTQEVPGGAFMARALTEGGLEGVTGVVRYRPEIEAL
jgi:putative acetyltransferase